MTELGDRLGPINWQFMATKKFDPVDFEAFLKLLPREVGGLPLRHALELRSPTFKTEQFYDLARRYNAAICFADDEDFPVLDETTADFTYARLMRHPGRDRDRLSPPPISTAGPNGPRIGPSAATLSSISSPAPSTARRPPRWR